MQRAIPTLSEQEGTAGQHRLQLLCTLQLRSLSWPDWGDHGGDRGLRGRGRTSDFGLEGAPPKAEGQTGPRRSSSEDLLREGTRTRFLSWGMDQSIHITSQDLLTGPPVRQPKLYYTWGNTNRVVSNRIVSKGPLYPSKTKHLFCCFLKLIIFLCFLIRPHLYASDIRWCTVSCCIIVRNNTAC